MIVVETTGGMNARANIALGARVSALIVVTRSLEGMEARLNIGLHVRVFALTG